MNYISIVLVFLAGSLSLVHRMMVRKIYDADGRSLSTFSLPRVIRREYKARYGVDGFYRFSQIIPVLFFILVLAGFVLSFRR